MRRCWRCGIMYDGSSCASDEPICVKCFAIVGNTEGPKTLCVHFIPLDEDCSRCVQDVSGMTTFYQGPRSHNDKPIHVDFEKQRVTYTVPQKQVGQPAQVFWDERSLLCGQRIICREADGSCWAAITEEEKKALETGTKLIVGHDDEVVNKETSIKACSIGFKLDIKTEVVKAPDQKRLYEHPNPKQDAADLLRTVLASIKDTGQVYVWAVSNQFGAVCEYYHIPTSWIMNTQSSGMLIKKDTGEVVLIPYPELLSAPSWSAEQDKRLKPAKAVFQQYTPNIPKKPDAPYMGFGTVSWTDEPAPSTVKFGPMVDGYLSGTDGKYPIKCRWSWEDIEGSIKGLLSMTGHVIGVQPKGGAYICNFDGYAVNMVLGTDHMLRSCGTPKPTPTDEQMFGKEPIPTLDVGDEPTVVRRTDK